MSVAFKRSILFYINQHRPSALFRRALFFRAMERF
ncbi:hypothetical protein DFAR_650009 [Desulfarculales bacterium]